MPRKTTKRPRSTKKAQIIEHPTPREGITLYAKNSYKWAESYTSLLLGVVVIIVAVLFVVSLIRATHHIQDTSSTAIGPTPTTVLTPTNIPTKTHMYTVQPGDDLWSIAEKTYGSGYNWVDIAQVNNLSDPDALFAGNQLVLPSVTLAPSPTTSPSALGQVMTKGDAITGNSYTVHSGDNLWDIAVRAYGSGYKWVDIAKANSLVNPDLIFSGNVLQLPR